MDFNQNEIYKPTHYRSFGFENIDFIEELFKENVYFIYAFSFLKYLIRYEFKDKNKDLQKANFFLCLLIKYLTKNQGKSVLSLAQRKNLATYILKIKAKNSYLSQIIDSFISVFLSDENVNKQEIQGFEVDFVFFCNQEEKRLKRLKND